MRKELILENDVTQLARLEQFLEDSGRELQLEETVVQNLNLVLEEAVSNIIFYAYPDEPGQSLCLIMIKQGDYLELELQDSGIPFDPTIRPDPDIRQPAEEREIGGLGIFLIRQIMDEVKYKRENGKNVLRMKMFL